MSNRDEPFLRHRLLARIHRTYQTVTRPVEIGPLRFPFTRIADPDAVLDQVAAEEDRLERVSGRRADADQLHLPYWAELWDSATGIGQFLVRNPEGVAPVPGSRYPRFVLDLGCGMGLPGTVAAGLGAAVMFADLEPPALLFARLNSLPFAGGHFIKRRYPAHPNFQARRTMPAVRTRRLNWQADRLAEQFDLIIGADILYERKQWDYLEPFWRAHLSEGGSVLLGEPGRQTGDKFVDWIVERGWRLERHEEKVATREKPVRILRVTPAPR